MPYCGYRAHKGTHFELLFGDGFRIKGDFYRVIAPHTDDAANYGHLVVALLLYSIGTVLCLYGKKKKHQLQ